MICEHENIVTDYSDYHNETYTICEDCGEDMSINTEPDYTGATYNEGAAR